MFPNLFLCVYIYDRLVVFKHDCLSFKYFSFATKVIFFSMLPCIIHSGVVPFQFPESSQTLISSCDRL